jgi:hypothetical protein
MKVSLSSPSSDNIYGTPTLTLKILPPSNKFVEVVYNLTSSDVLITTGVSTGMFFLTLLIYPIL